MRTSKASENKATCECKLSISVLTNVSEPDGTILWFAKINHWFLADVTSDRGTSSSDGY